MFRSWVLLAVILSVAHGTVSEKDQPCKTPENKKGQCVEVRNCQAIISAITSKNNTAIEFAKKSQCGFYNSQPLVCCEILESEFLPKKDVCGLSVADKIYNGFATQMAQYTWIAALVFKKKATGEDVGIKCVGSLIDNRYVLTSAGCLSDEELELVHVRLGDWDLISDPDCDEITDFKYCSEPVRRFKVNKIIKHHNYNKASGSDDIALIQLQDIVTYSEFISPICLPTGIAPSFESFVPVVAGWGTTIKNDSSSNQLKAAQISLLSADECRKKIQNSKPLNTNEFCGVQKHTLQSCIGSIGSPLMMPVVSTNELNLYVDGILTWNDKCASNDPGVYTRVINYMPWILEIISKE
ncbi:hypothetical protein ILUMI_10308 [Ignelater luminosus]|uniref:CLIP domain-containing serine protease n=1 Tax=Ignelater luminosus TaxID=2038154 RepID=A0A8K0GF41_IGNLU|nr:hypothetical protein ILUMI_10308 [Ignelater luminosus]